MISEVALRIIKRAIQIRLNHGEELTQIIKDYTKLSETQKEEILIEFQKKEG